MDAPTQPLAHLRTTTTPEPSPDVEVDSLAHQLGAWLAEVAATQPQPEGSSHEVASA